MKKLITPVLLFVSLYCNAQQFVFSRIDVEPGSGSSNPRILGAIGSKVVFSADNSTYGNEIWITDGTQAGTKLLKDINAGTGNSYPGGFGYAVMNGKLYFTAGDNISGSELWVTDGTTAGTQMLKDINPGINSSIDGPTGLIAISNKLYFSAKDNVNGEEPWVSDGTSIGTRMLADINPGSQDSNPVSFNKLGSRVIFEAYNTNGNQLWSTDGTPAGTQLNTILYAGLGCSAVYTFTIMNNKAYFFSCSNTVGTELWVTDGTTAGTQLVKDIEPGTGSSYSSLSTDYQNIVALNGKLYFSAYNYVDGIEAWISDGTETGTQLLKDIEPGAASSGVIQFVTHNNRVYFNAANTVYGPELWKTDGTEAGTTIVKDIYPGWHGSLPMTDKLYVSQGKYLFFSTQKNPTSASDAKLWITDGTDTGTGEIKPVANSALSPLANCRNLYAHTDGSVYFAANYDNTGNELWITKDTSTSTSISSIQQEKSTTLYPNPAHHVFMVHTTTPFKTGSVTLTDITGKTVLNKYPITDTQLQIPLNDIAPGMYMADVWLDDKRSVQKLMIE